MKELTEEARHRLALKQELIDGAAQVASIGLVPLTQGNLSLRDPASGQILMTPHDHPYDALTPDDVVVLDLAGAVIEGSARALA